MARKPSLRKHGDMGVEDLDLTPIMSILVILIPMLIYAFNYTEIAVQEVSLPKTGGRSTPKGPKKLNLTVLVSNEGFRIKVQGELEGAPPPADQVLGKRQLTACGAEQAYSTFDYPGLYNALVKLRDNKNLGLEDTINIGAKDRIPWRVLARTIAAVRLRREKDSYTELCEFRGAVGKKTKKKNAEGKEVEVPQELFPKVVFIVL